MAKLNRDVELHSDHSHVDYFAGIRVKKGTKCYIEDTQNPGCLHTTVTVSIPRTNGIELLLTIPEEWVDE
jgi:hypothetical protein